MKQILILVLLLISGAFAQNTNCRTYYAGNELHTDCNTQPQVELKVDQIDWNAIQQNQLQQQQQKQFEQQRFDQNMRDLSNSIHRNNQLELQNNQLQIQKRQSQLDWKMQAFSQCEEVWGESSSKGVKQLSQDRWTDYIMNEWIIGCDKNDVESRMEAKEAQAEAIRKHNNKVTAWILGVLVGVPVLLLLLDVAGVPAP